LAEKIGRDRRIANQTIHVEGSIETARKAFFQIEAACEGLNEEYDDYEDTFLLIEKLDKL
jgi:hypothetical protein